MNKTSFDKLSTGKILSSCIVDFLLFAAMLVTQLLQMNRSHSEMRIMFILGIIVSIAACLAGIVHLWQSIKYNKTVAAGENCLAKLISVDSQKENGTVIAVLNFEDVKSGKNYTLKVKRGAAYDNYVLGSLCKVKVLGSFYVLYTNSAGIPIFEEEVIKDEKKG